MPNYTDSNVTHIIDADEFKALYNHCKNVRDQTWVSILWLTGARPQELIEMIKTDITILPDKIKFHIKTKKLEKD